MVKRIPFLVLLTIALFALTGCFRQADDSFQPVTVGDASGGQTVDTTPTSDAVFVPITPTDDEAGGQSLDPTPDPLLPQETPTVDPIIQQATDSAAGLSQQPPAETPLPLDAITQPTSDPNAPVIMTVEPSPTLEVLLPSDTPADTVTEPTSDGSTFITPGAPSFPDEIVTSTPAPLDPAVQPTSTPSGLVTPTNLPELDDSCIYIVRGGDSLYRIAIVNDTTVTALRTANPQLVGDLIRPGQRLTLPDCQSGNAEAGLTPAPTELVQPTDASPVSGTEYVVRAGDTLYDIGLRFGVTVQAIINANNLTNPDRLRIGQRLIIPTP